jgi:sec-independent protein translocase protein TatB
MFDIGWQELFIIGLITIVVIGPKELPRVLRTVTLWVRKIRGMAREFQDGLEELAREADVEEMRREIEASANVDLERELEGTIDPGGQIGDSVRELGETIEVNSGPSPEPASPRGAADHSGRGETPNHDPEGASDRARPAGGESGGAV